jgi:hypothetical protein
MASHKYNRTPHLTFSPGSTSDDKRLASNDHFLDKEIVLTAKLDGSGVMVSREYCFARSHNNVPKHPSFDLLKQLHSQIKHSIPDNLLIYGEYCLALHSLPYTQLPSYLLVFNVLDAPADTWLSWDDVCRLTNELGLTTVPVLWQGTFSTERALQSKIEALAGQKEFGVDEREGVVIRLATQFPRNEFAKSMAKYVKREFVDINKDEHWKHKQIVKNGLKVK